ncbi:MAG TPA: hypothetical protein VMF12_11815 [Xanthobacteraceae bacterium]|nr:hypothetical protein [Xanthobacteraceae bacterium]
MNKHLTCLGGLALLFTAAAVETVLAQAVPQSAVQAPAGAAAAPYAMTLGDMMNTLIQPRHAKLGLAGHAQNWALAEYALVEIRQGFAGIVKAVPNFHGLPVGQLVDAALSRPMDAVDAAIKEQNPQKFAAAYAQLTSGCNACHSALDHPFVVIKAPDASAFPNQDFNPR